MSVVFRILSDWLEAKFGGGNWAGGEEQPDGALQTVCVTNTLQDKGQHTHKVHISVKVRSHCSHVHSICAGECKVSYS